MSQLKQSIRSLARTPVLSLVVVVTLGLAVGSVAAVFTLVDGVVLRQLPYPNATRLVQIDHAAPGIAMASLGVSAPLYEHYRENSTAAQEFALYHDLRVTLSGEGRPERYEAARVTPSLFAVLGIQPIRGRPFAAADGQPGGNPVVVIGHSLWHNRFGGEEQVLGSTLTIDGEGHEVVGVLPPGQAFPERGTDLWLPRVIRPEERQLGYFSDYGLALLAPGHSLDQLGADLNRLVGNLATAFSGEAESLLEIGFTPAISSRLDNVVGKTRQLLWVLLAAAGLILLIAAANVANLFLVRTEERSQEIALRGALGASRLQLVLGVLRESLLLSVLAAGLGLVLAWMAVDLVVLARGESVPRLADVALDGRATVFALAVALLSGLAFGLLPALRATRRRRPAFASNRSSTAGPRRQRTRAVLVIGQLALGLVLAIGCSLVVRSFVALRAVDPGFRAEEALSFRTILPEAGYADAAARALFVHQALDKLAAIPGVRHAGSAGYLPLSGTGAGSVYQAEGRVGETRGSAPASRHVTVSAGYIEAMGIPLVAGRTLGAEDFRSEAPKVMVSQSFARRMWGEESALGQRITSGDPGAEQWYTVVGVVGDVHLFRLDEAPPEFVYLPLVGHPRVQGAIDHHVSFVLRTERGADSLRPQLYRTIAELDPSLALSTVQPLQLLVREAQASLSFTASLLTVASLMALTIAAVGLYGTLSFLVGTRRREIGIRMALGARQAQVRFSVLRQGLTLAGLGVLAGLLMSVLTTRGLEAVLFGVAALDPVSFLVMPLVLLAVALVATYVPAWRASHVQPQQALLAD